jgi:large subunit ribosomal protein L24
MKFNTRVTKQPRKQRKALYNAPLHERAKQVHCHLSKELRAKEKTRAKRLRKGDRVKVVRGKYKGRQGAITRVDLKHACVFIEGVVLKKQGGKEVPAAMNASNLILISLVSRGKQTTQEKRPAQKKDAKEEKAAAEMLAAAQK